VRFFALHEGDALWTSLQLSLHDCTSIIPTPFHAAWVFMALTNDMTEAEDGTQTRRLYYSIPEFSLPAILPPYRGLTTYLFAGVSDFPLACNESEYADVFNMAFLNALESGSLRVELPPGDMWNLPPNLDLVPIFANPIY
jgi:hypothetical protein